MNKIKGTYSGGDIPEDVKQIYNQAGLEGFYKWFEKQTGKQSWGGKRPGAGRKPTGRKQRNIRLTDEEFEKLKPFIDQVKSNHPSSKKL